MDASSSLFRRFGLDDAFVKFFRLGEMIEEVSEALRQGASQADAVSSLPLDRLSLLACTRQGLKPEELLVAVDNRSEERKERHGVRPASATAGGASSTAVAAAAEVAAAKAEAAEIRRLGKLRLAEQERRAIVAALRGVSPQNTQLTKEQSLLLTQLRSQEQQWKAEQKVEGLYECNDLTEADQCDILLSRKDGNDLQEALLQKQLARAERAGKLELERLKAIQQRSAVLDVTLELQRAAMQVRTASKEAALRQHLEEQREAMRRKAEEAERARRLKQKTCRERFVQAFRRRREELQARAAYRDSRVSETREEIHKSLAERQAQKLHEAQVALERVDQVDEQYQAQLIVQREEAEARALLSDANRERLHLQRLTALEMKRVAEAKKRETVAATLNESISIQEEKSKIVACKEEELARRRTAVQEAYLERSRALSEADRQLQEAAKANRIHHVDELLQKRELLQHEQEEKAERALAVQRERALQRSIRLELAEQRRSHHDENLQRVVRAHEYQQALKKTLSAQADERDHRRRAAQEKHRADMVLMNVQLRKQKEDLQRSIASLRHSGIAAVAAETTSAPPLLLPGAMLMIDTSEAHRAENNEDDANDYSSEGQAPTSMQRSAPRRASVGPSKEDLARQARILVAKQFESVAVERTKSPTAYGSGHHNKASTTSSPTDDVRGVSSRENDGARHGVESECTATLPSTRPGTAGPTRPHSAARLRRPLSAVARRAPEATIELPLRSYQRHGRPTRHLVLADRVVKQLARIDELDNFELEREVEKYMASKAGTVPPDTPVQELVKRMNAMYGTS